MDLTHPVIIGSATLNDVAYSGSLYGTTVDAIDLSEVDVRQFEEPLAKANGIETGGVWLGARHIAISGTLFGTDHDDLMDRAAALIADLSPVTGGYGLVAMSWYEDADTVGALNVRPDGPHFQWDRIRHGGSTSDPAAVHWTLKCIAPVPTIAYTAAPACITDNFDRSVSGGLGTGPFGAWTFDWGDTAEVSVDGSHYVAVIDGTTFPGNHADAHCNDYTYGFGISFRMSVKFRVALTTGNSGDYNTNVQLEDYNNGAGAGVIVHADAVQGLKQNLILNTGQYMEVTIEPDTDYILELGVRYVAGVQKARVYKASDPAPAWMLTGGCQVNPWPNETDPGVQPELDLYWSEITTQTFSVDYVKVCPGVDF